MGGTDSLPRGSDKVPRGLSEKIGRLESLFEEGVSDLEIKFRTLQQK